MGNRFIVQSEVLFWDTDFPLTYKLNDYDTRKSFTLICIIYKDYLGPMKGIVDF